MRGRLALGVPWWACVIVACGARSDLGVSTDAMTGADVTADAAACSPSWTVPLDAHAIPGAIDVLSDGTVVALALCGGPATSAPHPGPVVGSGQNALLFIDCGGRIQLERRLPDVWTADMCGGFSEVFALADGSALVAQTTNLSPDAVGMRIARYLPDATELFAKSFASTVAVAARRDGTWFALGACAGAPFCGSAPAVFLARFDGDAATAIRSFPASTSDSTSAAGLGIAALPSGGVVVVGGQDGGDPVTYQSIAGGPGGFTATFSAQLDLTGVTHDPANVLLASGRGDTAGYVLAGNVVDGTSEMGVDCSTNPCPGSLVARFDSGGVVYARTFDPFALNESICLEPDGNVAVLGYAAKKPATFGPFVIPNEGSFVGELAKDGTTVNATALDFTVEALGCDPDGARVLGAIAKASGSVGTIVHPTGPFIARGQLAP